ncbi:AAA family ATPase [Pectobacterium betavasculorum]|nr:AAA family ATPase [Pectobacterium betavasculorum]
MVDEIFILSYRDWGDLIVNIENIKINGLNSEANYSIDIEDNSFIIVGENGTDKSTVLSMTYYLLKGDWSKLTDYDYEDITITIDGYTCSFPKEELLNFFDNMEGKIGIGRQGTHLSERLRQFVYNYIKTILKDDFEKAHEKDVIYEIRNDFKRLGNPVPPFKLIEEYIHEYSSRSLVLFENDASGAQSDLLKSMKLIKEKVNCSLMYLPTYRRIEQDLEILFPNSKKLLDYIEDNIDGDGIVQFGMKDVEGLLNDAMNRLSSDFRNKLRELIAQSLQDILGNRYENLVPDENLSSVSEKEFEEILARVDSETLSSQVKEEIRKNTRHYGKTRGEKKPDKVIFYFINKLLELHKLQSENEIGLMNFISVCNKYLVNKEIYFDRVKFEISIVPKRNNIDRARTVKLDTLSSGEKQIISLFSKLYLGDRRDFIMIIDEPELSLSLEWQRSFLEDVKNSGFCEGIFAVTHSPFIYNNSLKKYAKGIGTLMEEL